MLLTREFLPVLGRWKVKLPFLSEVRCAEGLWSRSESSLLSTLPNHDRQDHEDYGAEVG